MKHEVTVLALAREDILRISDYHLRMVGAVSAEKITDKLLDGIERLSRYPLMGSLHGDPALAVQGYRKLICGEYLCIYRLIEETVFIYRVVHGSIDYPKYFSD